MLEKLLVFIKQYFSCELSFEKIFKNKTDNTTNEKRGMPVLITVISIFVFIIMFIVICNVLNKLSANLIIKIIAWIFYFSFCMYIICLLIAKFDNHSKNVNALIKSIYCISHFFISIIFIPINIINCLMKYVFGKNINLTFIYLYFGILIHFLVIFGALILIILHHLFNIFEYIDAAMIVLTITSYLFSLVWYFVFIKKFNVDCINNEDVLIAHNVFMYIIIFFVFIINNIFNDYSILKDGINTGISALTIFILIYDERRKNDKGNKQL